MSDWTMRLTDLNPKLEGSLERGVLRFDCPYPGHGHKLRIRVSRAAAHDEGDEHVWQADGEFPDTLTISPSINACKPEIECWHGHIKAGGIL